MEALRKKLKSLKTKNKNLKRRIDEAKPKEPEEETTDEGEPETEEPDEKDLPETPTPPLDSKQLAVIIKDLNARLSKVESYLFRVI